MSLHSFDLASTVYAALTGDSTLMGLVEGVYDDVPQDTPYPYIVVGEETTINAGTMTVDGLEHTLTLHVWSRYRGLKETKQIMERIYTLLHNSNLTVTGASLVNLRQEFSSTFVDADGLTRHGVIRFRAMVFDQ
jgi:hypothetical protein